MLTEKKISVIVVCYNDAGSIQEMYRRINVSMSGITHRYEIVYVDDASPDGAFMILKELADKDDRLTVISHARNFGGQNAYAHGLRYCSGDAAITLDGDIQDPPELFPAMVKKWLEGYDVVYGRRVKRKGVSLFYRFFYKAFYRVFRRMADIYMPLDASDFALIDRKVIDAINAMPESFRFYRGMRAWVGFRQTGIDYVRLPRFSGTGSSSLFGNVRWARNAIYDFSEKPLEWIFRISLVSGILFLAWLFGVAGMLYLGVSGLYSKIMFFLAFFVLFLGIIQVMILYIIAEYVVRIFREVKQRPNYITKKIINNHKGEQL